MLYENNLITFPSYSERPKTSGAIYAGVPTVDFGLECRTEDYTNFRNYFISRIKKLLSYESWEKLNCVKKKKTFE